MATSSTRKPSNLPRRIGDIIDRQIGNGADADAPSEARQLPLWHDLERAMPNMIARSALFAPIARGRRAMHERSEIASRSDVSIASGKCLPRMASASGPFSPEWKVLHSAAQPTTRGSSVGVPGANCVALRHRNSQPDSRSRRWAMHGAILFTTKIASAACRPSRRAR